MKYIITTILFTITLNAYAIDTYRVCPDGTVATGSLTCVIEDYPKEIDK